MAGQKLLPLAVLLFLLPGCGGGGISDAITPETDSRYSEDAKVLAVRLAGSSPTISASRAAAFDGDLQRIRTAYPIVKDIHTFPDFVLNELLFGVKLNAPGSTTGGMAISRPENPPSIAFCSPTTHRKSRGWSSSIATRSLS